MFAGASIVTLVAGQPVLPAEGKANAWIGCVGLLMTAVFVSGIVLRPQRRHLGLGLDSWVALLVYVVGIWGLVVVSS
jgi:cation:H+ antiporter